MTLNVEARGFWNMPHSNLKRIGDLKHDLILSAKKVNANPIDYISTYFEDAIVKDGEEVLHYIHDTRQNNCVTIQGACSLELEALQELIHGLQIIEQRMKDRHLINQYNNLI